MGMKHSRGYFMFKSIGLGICTRPIVKWAQDWETIKKKNQTLGPRRNRLHFIWYYPTLQHNIYRPKEAWTNNLIWAFMGLKCYKICQTIQQINKRIIWCWWRIKLVLLSPRSITPKAVSHCIFMCLFKNLVLFFYLCGCV